MQREIHTPPVTKKQAIEIQRRKEIGSDEKIDNDMVVIVVNGIQTIVAIKGVGSAKKRDAKLSAP